MTTGGNWSWSLMIFMLTLTSAISASNALVLPELNSSIGSELFEELCPGSITFTCNALDFGPYGFISWFINDTQLAVYAHNTGSNVNTSILNASVKISSSRFDNNQFSFSNFTLTVDINDLLSFQGQNITCGTMTVRSNSISIGNFTILENGVESISYLAKYQGAEGELEEIVVQWTDQFQLAKCEVTTSYSVQLLSSKEEISRVILSTQNCTNGQCSVRFSSNFKNAASYEITIVADNQFNSDNFTTTAFMNTTGNLISFNACNKTASITCSTSINESCTVTSNDSTSPAILMPGRTDLLTFSTTPDSIFITITINSTILTQTFNLDRGTMSDTEEGVFVGVGVAVFILGCIILTLGCVVGIVSKIQNNTNKDYRYMLKVTLLFSIIPMVIFIVTLVLWILVGSTSSIDSCFNDGVSPDPILIAALVFSFVLLLLASITIGGFLVALKCERKHRSHKKETFISYEVKFGTKEVKVKNTAGVQKCTICSQPFSNMHTNEDGTLVFKAASGTEHICNICCEHMCEKCFKIVYLKLCKQERDICSNCYKDYQAEKKKIPSSLQLGNIKPPRVDCSKYCKECGHKEGQKYTKWGKKEEMYTANISVCSTCGQWVCSECFDEHEVEVEYLHEKRQVCKNCYAVYKMTSQDDKEDSEKNVSLDTMARAEVTENKQNTNSTSL